LLLLTYIISHVPSVFYHHHKSEISSYELTTACEKVIYFSEKNGDCHHKSHVSKTIEKCSICDKHSLSVHNFQPFELYFNRLSIHRVFDETPLKFYSREILFSSNKSPPLVSSFII